MRSDAVSERRGPSRLTIVLAVVLGLLALVLAVVVVVNEVLRRRVGEELDRIRAAGEPVFVANPEGIVDPNSAAVVAWLDALDNAAQSASPVEASETLAACRSQGRHLGSEWEELEHALDVALVLDDCDRAALGLRAAELEPLVAEASRAGELGRFAPRGETRTAPLVSGFLPGAQALAWSAVSSAVSGAPDVTVERLVAGVDVARLIEPHSQIALGFSIMAWTEVLDALRRALPHLPGGTDLSEVRRAIDTELDEGRPRRAATDALVEERAFSNTMITQYRHFLGPSRRYGPLFHQDHLDFLRYYGELIAAAKSPWWESAAHREEADRWATTRVGRTFGLWSAARMLELAVELEAELALARAALVLHRDGVEALRAHVASTVDPFSGSPLLLREEGDGVIVLWSVGPDGVDDGGTIPGDRKHAPDVVWRLRAH